LKNFSHPAIVHYTSLNVKISGWHTTVINFKNDISVATFSDLIVNRNKTEGLWIGKVKQSKDKVEHITVGQTNQ
jgi:hypothetical protein